MGVWHQEQRNALIEMEHVSHPSTYDHRARPSSSISWGGRNAKRQG